MLQTNQLSQIRLPELNLGQNPFRDPRATFYFISPHLDDAIFSAGGLLDSLCQTHRVIVINIFTKGGNKPYTQSANRYLRLCGYTDIHMLYKDRTEEDKSIFQNLKVESLYLGYTDCLWRINQNLNRNPIRQYVAKYIPELVHMYPTFRFHANTGRIAKDDLKISYDIYEQLKKVIGTDSHAVVLYPLGIGKHVDHLIVKQACDRLDVEKIQWADFPYNVQSHNNWHEIYQCNYQYSFNSSRRYRLIKSYTTQLGAIFNNHIPDQLPEFYLLHTTLN